MLREDEKFYLPNLYNFQNDNVFYGSYRGLRFRVKSQKAQDEKAQWSMEVLCWYGEYCLEESEVAASASFPMSEEGYEAVLNYLDEQYDLMMERQAQP